MFKDPVCFLTFTPHLSQCSRVKIMHFEVGYKIKDHVTSHTNTSHTKTMLPTRKSVPRSRRQLDHMKISRRSWRDANCSGMAMSPVHQVWPKPSCKTQWKGEGDKAVKERGGKTTSGNGQAWNSASPRGQWRTEKWRKLVAKSSVVPQRPSRLRDWWWWWWRWCKIKEQQFAYSTTNFY